MYRTIVVAIGSEILSGAVVDTNSSFLSKELSELSFEVIRHIAVQDQPETIHEVLRQALQEAHLVVVTGGLGPTFDDLTKQTLAKFFERPLTFNPRQFKRIKDYFQARKHPLHSYVRQQASFPKSCRIFDNNFGVAPGIGMEDQGKWVIALPGVPREMEGMFRGEVIPFLKKKFVSALVQETLCAKFISLNETEVLKKLGKTFPPQDQNIECGIYPSTGEVTLKMRFTGKSRRTLEAKKRFWQAVMLRKLGRFVVGFRDEPFEKTVAELFQKKRYSLALAESVTGGLIAKRFTDIEGTSKFLRGGMMVYSDQAKQQILGLNRDLIKNHSAVSVPVARQMAYLARVKFGTTWGLSTTGVAGPTKGGAKEPVGTVFIGISSKRGTYVTRCLFRGVREKVRWLASQKALAMLREKLLDG